MTLVTTEQERPRDCPYAVKLKNQLLEWQPGENLIAKIMPNESSIDLETICC